LAYGSHAQPGRSRGNYAETPDPSSHNEGNSFARFHLVSSFATDGSTVLQVALDSEVENSRKLEQEREVRHEHSR
jgi:hypothetical protein